MDDLVVQGLELYAAGDLSGAARLWLRARQTHGESAEVERYLSHLQQVAPLVFQRAAQLSLEGADAAAREEESVAQRACEPPPADREQAAEPGAAGEPRPGWAAWGAGGRRGAAVLGVDGWGRRADSFVEVSGTAVALGLVRAREVAPVRQARPSLGSRERVAALTARLRELADLDDFTSVLQLAEQILALESGHELATRERVRCRAKLMRLYESKIGGGGAVPHVLIGPSEVIWQDLDHRAAFVLAQVDGTSSNDEIADVTGLDRLDSLRILASLVQNGVIGPAATQS